MYGGFQPVYPPKRQSDGLHPGSYIYKALHIYRSPRTNQGSDETPETGTWFHGVTGSGMWLELGSQERGLPPLDPRYMGISGSTPSPEG